MSLCGVGLRESALLLIGHCPSLLPSIYKVSVLVGAMLVYGLLALLGQVLPHLGTLWVVNRSPHHLACDAVLSLGG